MKNKVLKFGEFITKDNDYKIISEAKKEEVEDPEAADAKEAKPKKKKKKRKKKDEVEFVPITGRTKNLKTRDALLTVNRIKRLDKPLRDTMKSEKKPKKS